jgi:hypothetical protein
MLALIFGACGGQVEGAGEDLSPAETPDLMGADLDTTRGMDVDMALPPAATCQERLVQLGIDFDVAGPSKGVADPVSVKLPLNGIQYYGYGGSTPQTKLMMDCSLAVALHRLGEVAKAFDIVALEHIGIYNYRCIGGGDPSTGCELSQHAFAKAIDIHELRDKNGVTYNTETDWVIDPDDKTCTAPTANNKDKLLHDIVCEWHKQKVFHILLTPNYNAAHRNHFHVDLTTGASFITAEDPDAVGVDPPHAHDDL